MDITDTVALNDPQQADSVLDARDSLSEEMAIDTIQNHSAGTSLETSKVDPAQVIAFAQKLVGTPYVYGSTDPATGFDCSGFITYVFSHFGIKVPRSSRDFQQVGVTVPVEKAMPGDLILFTSPGSDNTRTREIGHIGLVTSNKDSVISFIHSTSGKAMSVVNTPMTEHYKKRFVRVARVFG